MSSQVSSENLQSILRKKRALSPDVSHRPRWRRLCGVPGSSAVPGPRADGGRLAFRRAGIARSAAASPAIFVRRRPCRGDDGRAAAGRLAVCPLECRSAPSTCRRSTANARCRRRKSQRSQSRTARGGQMHRLLWTCSRQRKNRELVGRCRAPKSVAPPGRTVTGWQMQPSRSSTGRRCSPTRHFDIRRFAATTPMRRRGDRNRAARCNALHVSSRQPPTLRRGGSCFPRR